MFPYELATQLWKRGWHYPRCRRHRDTYEHPWYIPWDEWQTRHPITDEHIAEANEILAIHVVTLPVQPGRGKKAVGRTPPIKTIRRERLGDISWEDAIAEGIAEVPNKWGTSWWLGPVGGEFKGPVTSYTRLWESIYGKGAWDRMKDDDVWVLDFGAVK